MKNLSLFFVTLFGFILFSCSDSSSGSGGDTSGTIVGTWDLIFLEYTGETVTIDLEDGFTVTQQIDVKGDNFDFQITYGEDATVHSEGSYRLIIESEVLGNIVRDTVYVDNDHNPGEYLFDDPLLTVFDSSGVVTESTVTMLTQDMMVYSFNRITRDTIGNLVLDADYDYEYRFKR